MIYEWPMGYYHKVNRDPSATCERLVASCQKTTVHPLVDRVLPIGRGP